MYDYVIVGGGSSGCALAARLSEDGQARVLLLEAGGPDRDRMIHRPAAFYRMTTGPYTWGYATAPLRQADGREMVFPQGRVLGGGVVDQRHGLHARQRPRLRRVGGGGGLRRLVLPRGAALLPAGRGQ